MRVPKILISFLLFLSATKYADLGSARSVMTCSFEGNKTPIFVNEKIFPYFTWLLTVTLALGNVVGQKRTAYNAFFKLEIINFPGQLKKSVTSRHFTFNER